MSSSPKVRKAVIPAQFGISGRYLLEPAFWDFIGQTDPDVLSTFFPPLFRRTKSLQAGPLLNPASLIA